MKKLEEIEAAIAQLPRDDFYNLIRHLRQRHEEEWDRQIEDDARSGRLKEAYQQLCGQK